MEKMDKASLWTKIPRFFTIPNEIRGEFWRETIRKNNLSMLVVCAIIFVAELYNILRVLLWSKSGLGTLNNRIYFGMYCTLLAVAALWLLLRYIFRGADLRIQWAVQYTATVVFFFWHILLNSYDLMRTPDGRTVVFTTAILGLSIFIQMSSLFSLICFGSGYLLFYFLASPFLSSGDVLNLTITFFVALSVSVTNSHHTAVNLLQRREIVQMNAQLQDMVRKDPLTGLLNKAAMERGVAHRLAKEGGTLFLVDLDDFKGINDTFGHPCGDYILMEAALKMRGAFPEGAMLGRIGGDEFAVFIDRAASENDALAMGGRFIESFSGIQWNGWAINVGCSVGVCVCRQPGISYEQLYQETDRVLYEAKSVGKGTCRFHAV